MNEPEISARSRLFLTRLDYSTCQTGHCYITGTWCLSNEEILGRKTTNCRLIEYKLGSKDKQEEARHAVQSTFDQIIPLLTGRLNTLHGVKYSERFWGILVGYWLRQYLDNLYNRYQVLLAAKTAVPYGVVHLIPEEDLWIADDTDDFSVAVFTDRLNHQLFGQIIRYMDLFERIDDPGLPAGGSDRVGRKRTSETLKKIVFTVSCLLGKFNKVVILRTYFSAKLLAFLGIYYLSVPILGTPKLSVTRKKIDRKAREYLSETNMDKEDDFGRLAIALLGRNIPKIFVEGFRDLFIYSRFLMPFRARIYLTSNAFACYEMYKQWAALAVETGRGKHIIIQHGGNYGHSMVMSEEDFEIETSSCYLTVGWDKPGYDNVIPFIGSQRLGGIGAYEKNKPEIKTEGKLVWVLASMPRYYYTQWSAPQGPDFLQYLQEQVTFLLELSQESRSLIWCRPYTYEYGWNDIQFIEKQAGPLKRERKRKPLRQEINCARLVIFSYDCTSMMETMAMNVPTICFWNEDLWAWRKPARRMLERMKETGIFHSNPELAAKFISEKIQGDKLGDWWKSGEVQDVRSEFCRLYANTCDNEFFEWKNTINKWL